MSKLILYVDTSEIRDGKLVFPPLPRGSPAPLLPASRQEAAEWRRTLSSYKVPSPTGSQTAASCIQPDEKALVKYLPDYVRFRAVFEHISSQWALSE